MMVVMVVLVVVIVVMALLLNQSNVEKTPEKIFKNDEVYYIHARWINTTSTHYNSDPPGQPPVGCLAGGGSCSACGHSPGWSR
jgi:hypothetical protein